MALHHTRLAPALLAVILCLLGTDHAARGADAASPIAQQAANPADAIIGDWRPSDTPDVDIRIFGADGKYVGGVAKAANPALVNTEMLRGIEYVPESRTWKGEVFALKRGMFVPMTIRMTDSGFEMVAGSGIMSKTVEWVRISGGAK